MISIFSDSLSLYMVIILFNFYFLLRMLIILFNLYFLLFRAFYRQNATLRSSQELLIP